MHLDDADILRATVLTERPTCASPGGFAGGFAGDFIAQLSTCPSTNSFLDGARFAFSDADTTNATIESFCTSTAGVQNILVDAATQSAFLEGPGGGYAAAADGDGAPIAGGGDRATPSRDRRGARAARDRRRRPRRAHAGARARRRLVAERAPHRARAAAPRGVPLLVRLGAFGQRRRRAQLRAVAC